MSPQFVNVLVGLLQVAGPALVTFAVSQHWLPAGIDYAAIAAALGLTGWSAATTKVTK